MKRIPPPHPAQLAQAWRSEAEPSRVHWAGVGRWVVGKDPHNDYTKNAYSVFFEILIACRSCRRIDQTDLGHYSARFLSNLSDFRDSCCVFLIYLEYYGGS